MILENTAALRFSEWNFPTSDDINNEMGDFKLLPANKVINFKVIPFDNQYMCFTEFATKKEKLTFLSSLPDSLTLLGGFIMNGEEWLTQKELDHWTK